MKKDIETKIGQALNADYLEVINESGMHSVPSGSESHFKIIIVSHQFDGKSLLERHRILNNLLATELKEKIHALTLETFTPKEWEQRGKKPKKTPPCLGGSNSGTM